MDFTATARSDELHLRNTQAIRRSRILRYEGELGNARNAWGRSAEQTVRADEIVVDVDTIPRQVRKRAAQSVDCCCAIAGGSCYAGLQSSEIKRIPAIERQVVDLLSLHGAGKLSVGVVDRSSDV